MIMSYKEFMRQNADRIEELDLDPEDEYEQYVSKTTLLDCVGKTIHSTTEDGLIKFTDGSEIQLSGRHPDDPDMRTGYAVEPVKRVNCIGGSPIVGSCVLTSGGSPFPYLVGTVMQAHDREDEYAGCNDAEGKVIIEFDELYYASDIRSKVMQMLDDGGVPKRIPGSLYRPVAITTDKLIDISDMPRENHRRLYCDLEYSAAYGRERELQAKQLSTDGAEKEGGQ